MPRALTVLQPLPIERYSSGTSCVSLWGYAIPTKLGGLDAYKLPDLQKPAVDPRIPTRWVQDWEYLFKEYFRKPPALPAGRSEGVVLLAHHHGKGYVSWDGSSARNATNAMRRFPYGSFGLLAACSLTNNTQEGNDALLKSLNEQGLDMLILSPFDVDAEYGAVLAVAFTKAVAEIRKSSPSTGQPPISALFARARQLTAEHFATKKKTQYDEMALEFIVLGDYRLQLCPQ